MSKSNYICLIILLIFISLICLNINDMLRGDDSNTLIEKSVLDEACKEIFNNTDAVFVEQAWVATKLECEIPEDKNGFK